VNAVAASWFQLRFPSLVEPEHDSSTARTCMG